MILVTNEGFQPVPEHEQTQGAEVIAIENNDPVPIAGILDMPVDFDLAQSAFDLTDVNLIRIPFESFADGRGFSLAKQLRLKGYAGRLRASGHVLADQYQMAKRCGFDEIEISEELARRQPESQWTDQIRHTGNYQSRFMPAVQRKITQ